MFYIHQTCCISPQQTFTDPDINMLVESAGNKLTVIEPSCEGIPMKVLRRMNKGVRIGVGAALPLIQGLQELSGIIIGTANGGMEESILFLNQIIEYNEGILMPGNFVQSTANAAASQLSLLSHNKGYNMTHVHRGTAFENAVIDAAMMLKENRRHSYLLGAVDEISGYNYKFEQIEGWYKKEVVSNKHLYKSDSPGTIPGEGAVMFLVNNVKHNALAKLAAITTIHSENAMTVKHIMEDFLTNHVLAEGNIDLLLTGEDGDNRFEHFYLQCEALMDSNVTVARFKHMSGTYPTASAFALWLACRALTSQTLPGHMIKKQGSQTGYKNILIYNHDKGKQHSLMQVTITADGVHGKTL